MSDRRERVIRQEKQKALARLLIFLVVAGLALAGILHAYRGMTDWFIGLMVRVTESREGHLTDCLRARTVILNEETVLQSPCAGRFENLVREGERVRRGTVLGRFYPYGGGSINIAAPVSGVVLYYTDGLEDLLDKSGCKLLNPAIFAYRPRLVAGTGRIDRDARPFLKIVNNLRPTRLLVMVPKTPIVLKAGQEVSVRWNGRDLGPARVGYVTRDDNSLLAYLSLEEFCSELVRQRFTEMELVVESYTGTVVPSQAITKRNGVTGVYLLRKERVHFKNVDVVVTRGQQSVVKGIGPGEYVVITPGLVREGMVIGK